MYKFWLGFKPVKLGRVHTGLSIISSSSGGSSFSVLHDDSWNYIHGKLKSSDFDQQINDGTTMKFVRVKLRKKICPYWELLLKLV